MTDRVRSLGGALLDREALDELLQKLVLLACHTVGGADSVSITVADDGGYRTSNSTSDEALDIDQAQYDGGNGPCLQALRSAEQVQVRVGDDPGRWPTFDAKAQEEGVVAVLSTPLRRGPGKAIGALNIYAHEPDRLDDDSRLTAEVIGEHAAILVGNTLDLLSAAQLNEQLRQALASREIIGEAKGIIMERQSCTRDEAFDILRRASQRENRKLRDLAEELVLRVEARRREGREGRPGQ
jgi:GAF domain-containing protein